MLVAYGPAGQPVVADEVQLEQLLAWSHDQALYKICVGVCPFFL